MYTIGEGSDDCTSFNDVMRNGQDLVLNTAGTPCVQCLVGGQPATDAEFIFSQARVSSLDGIREENGVMIIDDSTTFLPDASVGRDVNCVAGNTGYSFQLISSGKY
jgi:hypothetical protein